MKLQEFQSCWDNYFPSCSCLWNHWVRHFRCNLSVWPCARWSHEKSSNANFKARKMLHVEAFVLFERHIWVYNDINKHIKQTCFLFHRHWEANKWPKTRQGIFVYFQLGAFNMKISRSRWSCIVWVNCWGLVANGCYWYRALDELQTCNT